MWLVYEIYNFSIKFYRHITCRSSHFIHNNFTKLNFNAIECNASYGKVTYSSFGNMKWGMGAEEIWVWVGKKYDLIHIYFDEVLYGLSDYILRSGLIVSNHAILSPYYDHMPEMRTRLRQQIIVQRRITFSQLSTTTWASIHCTETRFTTGARLGIISPHRLLD